MAALSTPGSPGPSFRKWSTIWAVLLAVASALLITSGAHAQTLTVLHSFSGPDGVQPTAALTYGGQGTLYGTASGGGRFGYGNVFKITAHGPSWVLLPIYSFKAYNDGANPLGPVTIGRDGAIYGTTIGEFDGQGTVFRLQPPPTPLPSPQSPWNITVMHTFTGLNGDGDQPVYVNLISDQQGNIYGTTQFGGYYQSFGTVWEESPDGNGAWSESILASFNLPTNGPLSGVIRDGAGNLYGTTADGGTVFELSPSGSGYETTILHTFSGREPSLAYGGLVQDQAGNLYGASFDGGQNGCGAVYEVSPSGGSWDFQVLYNFACPGLGVFGELTLDAAGNLYGVRYAGGAHDDGMLFKMSHTNGSWVFTDLHDFTAQEGFFAYGHVIFDPQGNIYGTSEAGGAFGHGSVWEFTP